MCGRRHDVHRATDDSLEATFDRRRHSRHDCFEHLAVMDDARLKIGFLSSDFDMHPVATLLRGFLSELSDGGTFEVPSHHRVYIYISISISIYIYIMFYDSNT